jgi:hypothetical protein
MSDFSPDGVFDRKNNEYTDGYGRGIRNIHPESACRERGACTIHSPTEHSMRAFPVHVRIPSPWDIKPMHFERICPHGVGHPDPDDMTYWISKGDPSMGVHGCDGCCKKEVYE